MGHSLAALAEREHYETGSGTAWTSERALTMRSDEAAERRSLPPGSRSQRARDPELSPLRVLTAGTGVTWLGVVMQGADGMPGRCGGAAKQQTERKLTSGVWLKSREKQLGEEFQSSGFFSDRKKKQLSKHQALLTQKQMRRRRL